MTMFLRVVSAADVCDAESFAGYAHQTIGTKRPNAKEMTVLKKQAKDFFAGNPLADWSTLVHTIGYLRATRRRLAMPWAIFTMVPWAFKDGFLPELDPSNRDLRDPYVESDIAFILEQETDPWWVAAMTLAIEPEARRDLVRMWKNRVTDV